MFSFSSICIHIENTTPPLADTVPLTKATDSMPQDVKGDEKENRKETQKENPQIMSIVRIVVGCIHDTDMSSLRDGSRSERAKDRNEVSDRATAC
jgi:hypothetical protein